MKGKTLLVIPKALFKLPKTLPFYKKNTVDVNYMLPTLNLR